LRAINQLTYSKEPRIGEALLFLLKCLFDGINARLRFGDFAFEHFYLNLEFLAASIQLVVGNAIWNGPSKHRQAGDLLQNAVGQSVVFLSCNHRKLLFLQAVETGFRLLHLRSEMSIWFCIQFLRAT
jgi:hypothetical protein